MTPEKLLELLKYIMENNGWQNLYENSFDKRRACFKYVDCSLDTRDGKVWKLMLREGVGVGVNMKEAIDFRIENDEDLKKVYEFLDKTYEA